MLEFDVNIGHFHDNGSEGELSTVVLHDESGRYGDLVYKLVREEASHAEGEDVDD